MPLVCPNMHDAMLYMLRNNVISNIDPYGIAIRTTCPYGLVAEIDTGLVAGGLESAVAIVEEDVYFPSACAGENTPTFYLFGVSFSPQLGHRPSVFIVLVKS